MSEEIIKVLDNLAQKFGMTIDWTSQNVMPYLEELIGRFIIFKNIQAIIWISLSIIFMGLSIWCLIKIIKWRRSEEYDEYDDFMFWGIGLMALIVTLVIFFIVLMCNIEGLTQNIFIPETTVIEYLKSITTPQI